MGSGENSRSGKHTMISPSLEPRATRMRSASSTRRHARASSNASMTSAPMAFPTFDGADDGVIAPLPAAHADFGKTRSPSVPTSSKVKIKPFLRKMSSNDKASLDLSRSQAENEGLGIYTSSNNMRREASGGGNRVGHTRTSSAVSQISTTTTASSNRHGAHYVHPMRQNPHTYTPPLAQSHQNSRANSDDGEDSYQNPHLGTSYTASNPQPYAPLPPPKRSQPPLHIRTQTSSNRLHSTSQSNINLPGTPSSLRYQDTVSPDAMLPASRSSIESALRKRSRSNTAGTTPADARATVAMLRAEFDAREAAKNQKYAEVEKRAAEKEARKQDRRDESRRRKDEQAERKRTRSNANSEKSMPLSSVEYNSTAALPVDEELEYIRRGKMPPPNIRSPPGVNLQRKGSKAGQAVGSQWSLFWFRFKTMWLKFKRSVGIKGRD